MTISTMIVIIITSSSSTAQCYLTKNTIPIQIKEKNQDKTFLLEPFETHFQMPSCFELPLIWLLLSSIPWSRSWWSPAPAQDWPRQPRWCSRSLLASSASAQPRLRIFLFFIHSMLAGNWNKNHSYSYRKWHLHKKAEPQKMRHLWIYICAFLGPVLILSTFTLNLCVFR